MSLYNMINGRNISLEILARPLLHIRADKFPRYRDIYIENGELHVYTRMGGGNSECWEKKADDCKCPACTAKSIEVLYCNKRFDDDFDETYCTFVIKIPDDFKVDFEKLKAGHTSDFSKEYNKKIVEFIDELLSEFKTEEGKENLKAFREKFAEEGEESEPIRTETTGTNQDM